MELSQLRYFQTVSRLEHFTRAAEELHISQPSLSKSIANLEEELGVQLFDRNNRTVHLNSYGKALLAHVDKILYEADEAQLELRDMRSGERGDIGVASTFYLDFPDGPIDFIRRFLFDNPALSLHVYYMESSHMISLLQERKITFAMTTDNIDNPDIVSEELFSYRMGIVVSEDDPLAKRESVCMEELKNYPFLSNNSSPDLHDSIYDICTKAGFRPRVKIECDNGDLIGEAVSRGMGISFVTERRFRLNNTLGTGKPWRKRLVFVRVRDDFCTRTIRISYLRDAYRSACEKAFLKQIKEYFQRQKENT